MAVSGQDQPNLTPAYGQIINQLQNRANMEATRPSPLDIGTNIVNRVDQELTSRRQFEEKMAGEGRHLVTDQGIGEFLNELNQDVPDGHKLTAEDFASFKGLYVTPQEASAYGHQKLLSKTFDTEQKKQASAVDPKASADSVFNKPKLINKEVIVDPKSSTGLRYRNFYSDNSSELGDEAPKTSGGGVGGSGGVKSKDNFGRDVVYYPDGSSRVLNGAPKITKTGELAKEQAQLHPAELKTFQEGIKDFNTKVSKESKQTFDELKKLETSVKENNPISFFNNKIELTKLGGISAGRIAQGEIVQEAGARDFLSQAQQKIQTLKQGDWTPENKQLILQYIDTLRKVEKEHLNGQLESATDQTLSSMPDPARIDPNFIKQEFAKPVSQYINDDQAAIDFLKANHKLINPDTIKAAKGFLGK